MFRETQNPKEMYSGVFHGGSVTALKVQTLVKESVSGKDQKKVLPMSASMVNPLAQSPTEITDTLYC